MIKGYCDDRFLKIKNIFSNQINNGYELGCSVAVEYKGKEVINLYGGYTDETKTNLWKKNTLVNVWSVTKAVTGVCIVKLISENKLNLIVLWYQINYGLIKFLDNNSFIDLD